MQLTPFTKRDFETLYNFMQPIWEETYGDILSKEQIFFLLDKYFPPTDCAITALLDINIIKSTKSAFWLPSKRTIPFISTNCIYRQMQEENNILHLCLTSC